MLGKPHNKNAFLFTLITGITVQRDSRTGLLFVNVQITMHVALYLHSSQWYHTLSCFEWL